tara:strand:- start:12456 stop:12728 length:273 start_codon:yes stop_codon:yes gene_type:complete
MSGDTQQTKRARGWQPIGTAPAGQSHPYSGGLGCAGFVLVYNGHHMGAAYCLEDQEEGEREWLADDGLFRPAPTHWMHLPPPPPTEGQQP